MDRTKWHNLTDEGRAYEILVKLVAIHKVLERLGLLMLLAMLMGACAWLLS